MSEPVPRPCRIPLPGELWRHVKTGNVYRIEALAREELTGETMVLYRANDGRVPSLLWTRPIDVFLWCEDASPRFVPHDKEPTCEV